MAAQRFYFLDGMRGVAAIAVLALHVSAVFGLGWKLNAHLAVDFFFCLSGFVIAHAYDPKLALGTGFGPLMASRLKRLYPMLLLGVVLGGLAGLAMARDANWLLASVGLGAALVPIFWTGALAYPVNFPMWSLFFEILASAAYAIEARRLPIRVLLAGTAALGLALAGLTYISGELGFGVGGKTFVVGLLRVLFPFAVGVLFARLELWKRIPQISPALLVAALALVLFTPFQHWTIEVVSGLLILPAIVLAGASVRASSLDELWDYFGRLSYPLYIVHIPVLTLLKVATPEGYQVQAAALAVALSVVVGHLALVIYDEPVRRWLAKATARRIVAVAPDPA